MWVRESGTSVCHLFTWSRQMTWHIVSCERERIAHTLMCQWERGAYDTDMLSHVTCLYHMPCVNESCHVVSHIWQHVCIICHSLSASGTSHTHTHSRYDMSRYEITRLYHMPLALIYATCSHNMIQICYESEWHMIQTCYLIESEWHMIQTCCITWLMHISHVPCLYPMCETMWLSCQWERVVHRRATRSHEAMGRCGTLSHSRETISFTTAHHLAHMIQTSYT